MDQARERMVDQQIARRGIRDPRVLAAFRVVPREAFVPPPLAGLALGDFPVPIGQGQTISQPYIVARMAEALGLLGTERVLEIGTGSGYGAAILSRLAGSVHTVERLEAMAEAARERLDRLGFGSVQVRHGDGTLGWPQHAPYDAIAVTAAGPRVPEALLEQLAPGGRLVMPVGPEARQWLIRLTRGEAGELQEATLDPVCFVPLIGAQGWQPR